MEWIALAWRFRNEIAIGLIILALVSAGLYIKSVFNERDKLEIEISQIKKDMESVQAQLVLTREIADAIKKLKIQSSNYVSVVEATPSPPAGSSFVAVSGGMFLPSRYEAHSSARNTAPLSEGDENSTP